jgi:hypothetical protein
MALALAGNSSALLEQPQITATAALPEKYVANMQQDDAEFVAETVMKRKIQKQKKKQCKKLRAQYAAEKNELHGWPVPLTLEEAKTFKLENGLEFKSKNEFTSRVMSKCEVDNKRFITLVSRPDSVHVKCPFPSCKMDVTCGLRKKSGNYLLFNYNDILVFFF